MRFLNNYCQVCTTSTRREREVWMLILNFVRLMTKKMMTVMVLTIKVVVMTMISVRKRTIVTIFRKD